MGSIRVDGGGKTVAQKSNLQVKDFTFIQSNCHLYY